MNKADVDYSLYLVTDSELTKERGLYPCVAEALKGGVTLLQLREKNKSTKDFYDIALEIKKLAATHHIPLIINDRMDIALAVDADGLHIGQDDMPLTIARKFMGQDKLIGVSATTLEEAVQAQEEGADYVGVGAVFTTPSKKDAKPVSLQELTRIKAALKIPVVAIGGINETNAEKLKPAGINGISVISAILGKQDIQQAARELRDLIESK